MIISMISPMIIIMSNDIVMYMIYPQLPYITISIIIIIIISTMIGNGLPLYSDDHDHYHYSNYNPYKSGDF